MAQGGSLSINPDTGLPEAGVLDNLLPAIIGAGLMFATGGTAAPLVAGISNPALIGLGIGGLETLRTGDLNRGIMAGLGAYGGAGLAGPFAAAGPGFTVASPQAMSQATALAEAAPAAQMGVTGGEALFPNLPPPDVYANPFIDVAGQPYGVTMPMESPLRNIYETSGGGFQIAPELGAESPALDFRLQPNVYSDQELAARAASAAAPQPTVVEGLGMGEPGYTAADIDAYRSSLRSPTTANLMSPVEISGTPPPSGLQALKMMPKKELAKYGLAAAAPALLAPPEVKAPEADTEQYRYAYTPGRIADPEAGYTGASTGERMYFQPQYTRLAAGGPVEAMSAANIYDMQRARGGVSDLGVDMSTGQERLARGGISHLGDYSDGGRLLRGPGDGVSDSIPATIANKRPARLADGEFVVPARIVSELGNGSTEAGARKLYAMMDRVQRARGKTTGKGKVAKNTRAEKYLPA
jgi:hypothetical protein